jgi:hypothetical protein
MGRSQRRAPAASVHWRTCWSGALEGIRITSPRRGWSPEIRHPGGTESPADSRSGMTRWPRPCSIPTVTSSRDRRPRPGGIHVHMDTGGWPEPKIANSPGASTGPSEATTPGSRLSQPSRCADSHATTSSSLLRSDGSNSNRSTARPARPRVGGLTRTGPVPAQEVAVPKHGSHHQDRTTRTSPRSHARLGGDLDVGRGRVAPEVASRGIRSPPPVSFPPKGAAPAPRRWTGGRSGGGVSCSVRVGFLGAVSVWPAWG